MLTRQSLRRFLPIIIAGGLGLAIAACGSDVKQMTVTLLELSDSGQSGVATLTA